MMATVHPTTSSLVPLLESLEDPAVGQVEQTDAYLTIASRLSGEEGKHFLPAVAKHFSRLGKVFQAHIASPNVELCQAALQALGFCVFHGAIVSGIPANFMEEILTALNSIVVKSTDKNTCTRALWVISKQNFPSDVVSRKVPDILKTLEAVRSREDLQSVIMEHEALNVVIRLLEQTPSPMGEGAVQWAKLVIPLVVHSASKVRLRAAAALEMGMPLLLQKQQEVAAVIEPLMSSKLIPELQKLFSTKNESNVLKLWPLFVRLLGKVLHRGGPFINSLLHLEELGFRSSSPIIKKIAFIAWKSLIDNFALNPEILCSAKRLKLLMQPLSSIQVRTEALLLTKLEVWWYLVVKLGPSLAVNFEQVAVPLLQIAVSTESPLLSVSTSSRNCSQNTSLATPKSGSHPFSSPASTPRLGLNSSSSAQPAYSSIQLLGLEMLLHYFLGSEVTAAAAKSKLQLNLEPLTHPLLTGPSSFTKHAAVLISAVRDSFIGIGKDAPEALLTLIWKSLIGFVTAAMETGSKKDRPGSEVLTLLLQALESIVTSEALPAQRTLGLLEATVKGIPHKVLGSAAYQVANMDVLNGTPALFLIPLFHHSGVLPCFVTDERFFLCLETLIGCGLSGPASPLAFCESVLGVMSRNAEAIENGEHLWRMWSIVVNPLTDTITQTNEVNQGDALEHNYTALLRALMFPVTHLLIGHALSQMTQKSLLSTWSRLYRAFARCSALVATAEENVCCEELCAKMAAVLDSKVLSNPSTLEAVASLLLVVIECVDFTPYTPHYQKTKSPHTPLGWVRKKNKALGNLSTFQALLVLALESFLSALESFLSRDAPETAAEGSAGVPTGGTGTVLLAILSALFGNLALGTAVLGALSALSAPLARLYEHAGRPQNEQPKFFSGLGPKLEKLLGEILGCLQTRSSLVFDDELLALLAPLLRVLFPHRSKPLRNLATQFWNATFAHAPTLTYPEDLKPVLSQVKQKMPIILPGFQAVDVPEEFSGQYSGESSQMETQISGVKIASVGKRDSLLSRAEELREKGSSGPSKPIAVKLDFGSPKVPRRELLEEEASMDFVFIPPETKERVLTEHQKEVKRTKRVDIPAMYNNLDASLDTTAFTQYTQSQEESMDKLPASDEPAGPEADGQAQVQDEKMETEEAPEPDMGPNQEDMDVGPVADSTGDEADKEETPAPPKEVEPKSEDGPPERDDRGAEETTTEETGESGGDDCDVSASSDVVSGTPPKPNSRRQSFITLEKYMEGKPASPVRVTKFTGPHSRASGNQDASNSQQNDVASEVPAEASTGVEAVEVAREPGRHGDASERQVSSRVEAEKEEQPHPQVEEAEKRRRSEGTEDEDDIIPDTQAGAGSAEAGKRETAASAEDAVPMKDEDSCADSTYDSCEDGYLNDSQCSEVSASPSEIRRSSRRRSRPLRPGEDREEVEGRYKRMRKGVPAKGMSQSDPQRPDPSPAGQIEGQSQAQPGEGDLKERLRKTRASSQTASPPSAQNDSQSLGRVTRRKSAGPAEEQVSKTKSETALSKPVSQTDSQSQGRSSRRSKVGGSAEEMSQTDSPMTLSKPVSQTYSQSQERPSKRTKLADPAEEMSQTDTQTSLSTPVSQTDSQSRGRPGRRSKASGPAEEMSQTDTQTSLTTPSSQTDSQSQGRSGRRSKVSGLSEEMSQTDTLMTLSTPVSQTDGQSQGRPSRRSKVSGPPEEMSQNDTQARLTTPVSQTDGQSRGRPGRRSKSSGPPGEMSQTDTQASLSTPVSQTDGQSRGRPGRRSKPSDLSEEMSQTDTQASLSTPVSQTDGQSRGRPGRRSKVSRPSEEMSQTDTQTSLTTPVSQTDSQSRGRPGRRSKASDPSAEMSQTDAQTGLSTPLGQNNSQLQSRSTRNSKATDPTVEVSQTDFHPALSTPVSQTDSQSQGRPSRRSKVAGPPGEMSQTDTQASLSTPVSQTDSQSRGKQSKRSKTAAELNVGSSQCSASAMESEHSQLTDKGEGTQESSQDLGQSKTRGSSQGLLSGIENSELNLSETQSDDSQKSSKRGRRSKLLNSKAVPPSPPNAQQVPEGSKEMGAIESTSEVEMEACELGQKSESKSVPVNTDAEAVEPSEEKENENVTEIMVPDGTANVIVESRAELKTASEAFANVTSEMQEEISEPSAEPSTETRGLAVDSQEVQTKRGHRRSRSNSEAADVEGALSQDCDVSSSQGSTGSPDPGEIAVPPAPGEPLSDSKAACPPQPEEDASLPQQQEDAATAEANDDVFLEANATSTPKLSECLPAASASDAEETAWSTTAEEKWRTCDSETPSGVQLSDPAEVTEDGQQQDADVPQVTDGTESAVDPAKEQVDEENSTMQEQDINQQEAFVSAQEQNAPKEVVLEEAEEDRVPQMDSDVPIAAAAADTAAFPALPEEPAAPQQVTAEPLCLDSPLKQKLLDSVAGELGQSPSSGKSKGVWSPSASPSTSILKKGQKRPLEVESPSPLQKSRRVSFADPIHHQELADDIDRRSPVIRQSGGSSPRSKNMAAVSSQQKFVTTPTKGLFTLSPRNLRSPGFKSSKKCLISEMSQEPKPIPRDCVYPALVSCSAPVEAVLPQISSNMWPRGFGQLVRARNIRTVGDLSALTPTEIKTLPIRSPKLSNVKKALKNYHEQQRKGRNDELKGFDEMEKMTSEPEEMEMAHQQEEGKPPGEQVTDAESADVPAPPPAEQTSVELPSAVEALGARLTPGELGRCSPGQLVLMHEQLGGMMRAIVAQLQARLAPSAGESLP
ncbi:telomere-associated protein RIF1 isoform X2 [Anguilla anguilla]|uniref:telomere-associated protein RIF1 isoform X2 n=1 Tax=Anguilla anguilla TaxID=7936 RepID=UPI0015A857E6|nr:telomere-associated protein RIF1 isoform X2 [Anguilla anguilla]